MARSDVGVIEHGSSSLGRWFRQHRLRLAASVAVVEGLLVIFHAISWWVALPIAALIIVVYWYGGRTSGPYTVRQITRAAALSQGLGAVVPHRVAVLGAVAPADVGP